MDVVHPTTSARFLRAATALVQDAQEQLGSDVAWLVTRADGGEHVVVCAAGQERGLREGERVELLSDADLVLPLEHPDGSVFGALCALGAAGSAHHDAHLAHARRLAEVLSAMLAAEWEASVAAQRAEEESRRADRAIEEAMADPLTGVANRRAWDLAVAAEERRRRRYGGHAAIVVVDVDSLRSVNETQGHLGGDLLLRMVADTLADASRDSDTVARVGDDEFALLALDCDDSHLRVVVSRLRRALAQAGVGASVGGASRRPGVGLEAAWSEANGALQDDKVRREG